MSPDRSHAMLLTCLACLAAAAFLLVGVTPGSGAERPGPAGDSSSLNIHTVDWRDVTLPGAACDAPRPIHLHHSTALIKPIPARWLRDNFFGKHGVTVDAGSSNIVYGDLAGGRTDAAGINVSCNNGGGTADGALLYSWVIFGVHSNRLSALGVITPKVQPPGQLPTVIGIAIHLGTITASEDFYGPEDPTCCSSGRATTIWTYAHGTLQPGAPAITRPANR